MGRLLKYFIALVSLWILLPKIASATGTWKPVTNSAPNANGGVSVLLTDGTVMVVTLDSALSADGKNYGNVWNLLTPDIHGSYTNGTWSQLPAMHRNRLYFSTQVLPSGNLYVAGGEYFITGNSAEVFNTLTDTWDTIINTIANGAIISDANSKLLPDGNVMQAIVVKPGFNTGTQNELYNPQSNTMTYANPILYCSDEASWVTLPDGSILNPDTYTESCERFIPSEGVWMYEGLIPTHLFDEHLYEMGAGLLLPNGKVFFLGDSMFTAIYTPSGNNQPGTWERGPAMPNINGRQLGCPDAPAAMLPNGKILCLFSPSATYNDSTYYYEFDYTTNLFTPLISPYGNYLDYSSGFSHTLLDLPDGSVLIGNYGYNQYYTYVADGSPLLEGKPTIDNIRSNCTHYSITGKLFNGISEGAAYGDDWQMSTNYPIVQLARNDSVYYAKTINWNRPGAVMTGTLEDTAHFILPESILSGPYQAKVIVNGIASDAYPVTLTCDGKGNKLIERGGALIYPNPSPSGIYTLDNSTGSDNGQLMIYDVIGQLIEIVNYQPFTTQQVDLSEKASGVYIYRMNNAGGSNNKTGKIIKE